MEALLAGLLCSAPCWLTIGFAWVVRAGVRWSEDVARRVAAANAERDDTEQDERDRLRAKVEDAAKAQAIIARVEALDPPAEPPPKPRPPLRLIPGGPDAELPPDLREAAASTLPPKPRLPDLPAGPDIPPGSYRLELPDPDGPQLTVWQRNYVRSLLNRRGAELSRDLKQLTTVEAEAIVAALGGKPKKLYTGGRAWGQKRPG